MNRHAPATRASLASGVLATLLGAILCAASQAAGNAATASTGAAPPASSVDAAGAAHPGEDIRDIRGPQLILPGWLLPALVAGGTVLAGGTYAVWRRQRHRRRPPAPLPFEVALQRLEGVRALMQPQKAGAFSIAVSDIVRSYIERAFGFTATQRTTEEFLRDLLELPNSTLVRHRALLSEFLHQCDLVKFAGVSLTLQNMESLHRSAGDFVRATARPEETDEHRATAPPPPESA